MAISTQVTASISSKLLNKAKSMFVIEHSSRKLPFQKKKISAEHSSAPPDHYVRGNLTSSNCILQVFLQTLSEEDGRVLATELVHRQFPLSFCALLQTQKVTDLFNVNWQ